METWNATPIYIHKTKIRGMKNHHLKVNCVQISPNEKFILTGMHNGHILILTLKKGEWNVTNSLKHHSQLVRSIIISENAEYFASGGEDEKFCIWQKENGKWKVIYSLSNKKYFTGILSISSTSDFQKIAISSRNKKITILEKERNKLKPNWKVVSIISGKHTHDIRSVSFSSDGEYMLSGSRDKTAIIWKKEPNLSKWIIEQKFTTTDEEIETAVLSKNADIAVLGTQNNNIYVYRRLTKNNKWNKMYVLKGHTHHIRTLSLSQDTKFLLSGSRDATVRLWDINTGKCLRVFAWNLSDIEGVMISHNNKYIVSASIDKTVQIWELIQGNRIKTLPYYPPTCLGVKEEGIEHICSNNNILYAGSRDGKILIGDYKSPNLTLTTATHNNRISSLNILSVVIYKKEKKYLVSTSHSGVLNVWAIIKNGLKREAHINTKMNILCASTSNKYIVIGGNDTTIEVYELRNNLQLQLVFKSKKYRVHSDFVRAIQITPDSNYIISGGLDNKVVIWKKDKDVEQWKPLDLQKQQNQHKKGIYSLAYTQIDDTNQIIASGSQDTTIKIWDITGKVLQTIYGHSDYVSSLDFSADGQTLFSASRDRSIRIWKLQKNKKQIIYSLLAVINNGNTHVSTVKWDESTKWIFAGSRDNTVVFWDYKYQIIWKYIRHLQKISYWNLELFRLLNGEALITKIYNWTISCKTQNVNLYEKCINTTFENLKNNLTEFDLWSNFGRLGLSSAITILSRERNFRQDAYLWGIYMEPELFWQHIIENEVTFNIVYLLYFIESETFDILQTPTKLKQIYPKLEKLTQRNRADTSIRLLLKFTGENIEYFYPIIKSINVAIQSDKGDVQTIRFSNFKYKDTEFIANATFKIDPQYRLEPKAILQVTKFEVELAKELQVQNKYFIKNHQNTIETITTQIEKANIHIKPMDVNIGNRFSIVNKLIEALMPKFVILSFVPTLTTIIILILQFLFPVILNKSIEKLILYTGYFIVALFFCVAIGIFIKDYYKKSKYKGDKS